MDLYIAKIKYSRNLMNCTGTKKGEYLVGIYSTKEKALRNARRKLRYLMLSDIDEKNFHGRVRHDIEYEILIEYALLNRTNHGLPWD